MLLFTEEAIARIVAGHGGRETAFLWPNTKSVAKREGGGSFYPSAWGRDPRGGFLREEQHREPVRLHGTGP